MKNKCTICSAYCSNLFCSINCRNDFKYQKYIKEWLEGKQSGIRGKTATSKHIRRYLLEVQNGKCARCGINEWFGIPIGLELEHIDGNWKNNKRSNLECLCPNCHSQTLTFKGRNKGKGRDTRYNYDSDFQKIPR